MSLRYDWQTKPRYYFAIFNDFQNKQQKHSIPLFCILFILISIFDVNPSRREIGQHFTIPDAWFYYELSFVLCIRSRSIQLFVTHFAGHPHTRLAIVRAGNHILYASLIAIDRLLRVTAYNFLARERKVSTLTFIGFLLNFDVSHVIDSSLPLKLLTVLSNEMFCVLLDCTNANKLTSTVTNKFPFALSLQATIMRWILSEFLRPTWTASAIKTVQQ